MKATTDQVIIDTIPSFLFENLNIDILTIPTSSVPDSYVYKLDSFSWGLKKLIFIFNLSLKPMLQNNWYQNVCQL